MKKNIVGNEKVDQPAGMARKVYLLRKKAFVGSPQESLKTKQAFPDFDRGEFLYISWWRRQKGAV